MTDSGLLCHLLGADEGRLAEDDQITGKALESFVAAAASFSAHDWRAMETLRDERGQSFRSGFLLYAGERTLPLGDRLWAVPVSALWSD